MNSFEVFKKFCKKSEDLREDLANRMSFVLPLLEKL